MNFSKLPLTQAMLANLDAIGYKQMTPIQSEALPAILEGRDVMAEAKTGSGKTAAFGIGLLHNLDVKKFRVQSLVLCPTRELADQVAKELRRLARFQHNIKILMLTGGESFGKQLGSLSHQAHIIVGTPGRVLKHLNKESLDLSNLNTFVLDEADRMLDMGFIEEIESVLSFVPKERQTLLFSATYDEEVKEVAHKLLHEPVVVQTTTDEKPNEIEERFYACSDKTEALIKVLSLEQPKNIIIFTNTKIEAKELAERLIARKIDALAIHGDLEQYERNDVLVQFANGSTPILVATDVAARGLDIKELAMVVNFDLPHTQETYTHRIGRTGRAGAKGIAITLYEAYELEKVEPYKTEEKRLFLDANDLVDVKGFEMKPEFITLVIEGGKKDKLRAGDILGALTGEAGLQGKSIGKIDIYERQAYVAIEREVVEKAYKYLKNGKIKNKKFSIWKL
ncbi:ATP-dependent RNA helicase DbpA [Sulfurimonas paralvinellae]|uniref:DEAD-box ATP-dependent RNA helicase RhpA n=1 Tax=Sulfurimonas paralvinellae TaxID=317658 RepID=A0A7M1BCS4_9BACT|nr:ATP-dependent RNA helicase DbpA [Sulfurimonas paralvinellae]QOP46592.1 ATP-dependent RNA helicase DbpA [Sulfurimonas paralvinellae]